ncbi:cysteine proteinase [Lichtheimia corymbifera JMRC:FSU:9682]|uniref:Cysteine proteinase n=1 Tax=Lichtheimia corymbifera JMRC:FSU:9682 TaxID=1263082 RepID=A0A068RG74_9FUNG|nr:cysteine proteinase [Lichtheimia corymbifera JMRC:FSU:9682]
MERFLGWATRMSSSSKPLLHYHDVVIRQHDYDTLADHCWLNDAILDFHMEYLDRNVISSDSKLKLLLLRPGMVELIVHIQDPTYLSSALPRDLDKADAIFIPINDSRPLAAYSGSHWSLMVFLRRFNAFFYYDSMGQSNGREAQLTRAQLTPLLGLQHSPAFIPVETPQQNNSADCGVYVIAITDNLVQRLLQTGGNVPPERLTRITKKDIRVKHIRKDLRQLIRSMQQ